MNDQKSNTGTNETFDAKMRNILALLMPAAPEQAEAVIKAIDELYRKEFKLVPRWKINKVDPLRPVDDDDAREMINGPDW